jgi:hypothetical protein
MQHHEGDGTGIDAEAAAYTALAVLLLVQVHDHLDVAAHGVWELGLAWR